MIIVLALAVLAALLVWKKHIPLGLDLRGGTELRYRIRTEELSAAEKRNITQSTIDVIRKRIDPEGRMELDIRASGEHEFIIQLPGMGPEESKRIEEMIRRAGKLRFCLVDDDPEDIDRAGRGERVPGYTPFLPAEYDEKGQVTRWRRGTFAELPAMAAKGGGWFLVENTARVTGEYLANPHPTDDDSGLPAVGFTFQGPGRRLFERLTEENRGKKLAIILDQDLYSAPTIQSRISGAGIITGKFTQNEVRDLIAVLRAGQLPADIELQWNNAVGAQLGEDSIRAGVYASIIALILVIVFMAIYYLSTGLIANLALVLNLLLVLGALAGLQAVLTLPGIAGLVLILGMAVDANVLINERIREESARGKTLRLAIRSGYERAFVTILDSNLTTLITGLILFTVGTGPVRGFATTLCLGIVISMFTAVWVTRWILEILVEHGIIRSLPMLQVFRRPNISFSRLRHAAMMLSFVCIVGGLLIFFSRGEEKYDTDLTGGFRAEMELQRGIPISEFRQRVSSIFRNADVQSAWSTEEARAQSAAPRRFSIRIRLPDDDPKRLDKMREDIVRVLREHDVFENIHQEPEPEWSFRVRLPRPLSELEMRGLLADAGYREAAVRELLLINTSSSDFLIRLRTALVASEQMDNAISKVLDTMGGLIVTQSPRIKIGEVVREENLIRGAVDRETQPAYVPIQLSEACSTPAVRRAIISEILGKRENEDIRVMGHGADQGMDKAREMAVWGPEDVLETIARSGKAELQVQSFDLPALGEIQLSLTAPQTEKAVIERFDPNTYATLIRAIIPLRVASNEFTIEMAPLSEEKAMEKIQSALVKEFADELAGGTGAQPPVMTSIEPPASEKPDETSTDVKYFTLKFAAPIQLQEAKAALTAAGYPDAIVSKETAFLATIAREDVSEVTVTLHGEPEQIEEAKARIIQAFAEKQKNPFRSIETIGKVVAGEMKDKAILAIILSWAAIVFYLWFRFGEAKFGLAAVVALIHDVLFTAGALGVADALSGSTLGNFLGFSDIKVNVTTIAAFLTLIGYSVNDTIVVFDRIRENMGGVRRRVDGPLVDMSVNQTLSRTVLTGMTTLLALVVLYIIGGPVIHGFAFVMTVGVIVGTYSSVFIASPILIGWESGVSAIRKLFRIITFRFD
jgi:protein-export membrane protein SecD/preprotein translocase SecF subunit